MEREEILFWKVFKNKYLLKEIFKKRTFRLGCYSYDECNNADWMVKNGYLNLLVEKINNNNLDLIIEKETIFKHFKNNNQSQIFSKLFKNYPELVECVLEIIKDDNLNAFELMVNEYNYIPTESNLLESIRIGSFSISNFIKSNGFFEITNELKDQIWEKSIGYQPLIIDNHYSKVDNELHYRKRKYFIDSFIDNDQYTTLPTPIEIDLRHVVRDKHGVFKFLNTNNIKIYNNFKFLFKMTIHEKPLEFILKCCSIIFTILKLQRKPLFPIERPSFILTIEELNEMKFTKDQLSTKIGQCDSYDDRIKKLFIMVLYFTNDFPMAENYTFLGMKYFKRLECEAALFEPIEFGVYYGKSLYECRIINPFRFCKNDKNNQTILDFITKSIADIKDPEFLGTHRISINKLLNACFIFNDLKLLELVYFNLSEGGDDFTFSLETFKLIKSTEIFDFIFNKIKSEECKVESFKYISENYQLAYHFKENYSDYYYRSLDTFPKISNLIHYRESNRFYYENWQDFNIDPISIWDLLLYHFCVINPSKIQELNKIGEITKPFCIHHAISNSRLIQVNYILTYRKNELKDLINNIKIDDLYMVSYLRGELKEYLENGLIKIERENPKYIPTILYELTKEIGQRNDHKTLEFLLSFYSNNSLVFNHLKNKNFLSRVNKKLNGYQNEK
ncbi:hypothetical protein ACTA71_004074 [Dictyostelium dimigraforme]